MQPFLTGQRVLVRAVPGVPWQVVIRIDPLVYQMLLPSSKVPTISESNPFYWPLLLVFDQCHLICCLTDEQYRDWQRFTQACEKKTPISKQDADALRDKHLRHHYG